VGTSWPRRWLACVGAARHRRKPPQQVVRTLTAAPPLIAAVALAGCGGHATQTARPLAATVVATGLEAPWDLAFLPGGDVLVTERPGRLRLVREGRLEPEPVAEVEVAAHGEAGLLGVALHPSFTDRPFVYLYATDAAGRENRILRFRLTKGGPAGVRLADERVLLGGIPAAPVHNGGRLRFGPDRMLYATTGDAGTPARAAYPRSLAGKILRLNPNGSVPTANPFPGFPVWSYGHRNPQGLAWDGDGRLYASDHGPTGEFGLCCHDEVNLIRRGGFYGWPLRAGAVRAATPGEIGLTHAPARIVNPVVESGGSTWAPSGIAFSGRGVVVATLADERSCGSGSIQLIRRGSCAGRSLSTGAVGCAPSTARPTDASTCAGGERPLGRYRRQPARRLLVGSVQRRRPRQRLGNAHPRRGAARRAPAHRAWNAAALALGFTLTTHTAWEVIGEQRQQQRQLDHEHRPAPHRVAG
jgi:glucose/arabinose dehydrogenase